MSVGVDAQIVTETLKNGGIYGAIISVLLSTIMGLILYIRSLHKTASKIYVYRLAERDTLKDALNESKHAIMLQVESTNDRNKLMEEMTKVIYTSNTQSDALNVLLKLQFEFLKDDHDRLNQVVAAMAESIRNLSTSSQTIQTGVQSLPPMLTSLQHHVENIVSRRIR